MGARRLLNAGSASVVFSTLLTVLGPLSAVAGDMWPQQAILLVHLPQSGGQFFTTNYLANSSSFVGANTGQTETSSARGDMPYFALGPGIQNFLVLVNPLAADRILTIRLYDPNGVALGDPFIRNFNGRGLQVLSIPEAFGLPSPRPSGSVTIVANGNGFLGWIVQVFPPSILLFTSIDLAEGNLTRLTRPNAP